MPSEHFELDRLPEAYRADTGEMVAEPCWRLLAPGYYGETFWLDGEILTADMIPNHHMEPLNRAAGERYLAWINTLPLKSHGLRQEDMIEAAYMLRPREGEKELPHDKWSDAVIRMALTMKAKREGTGALKIPELQGVRPLNGSGAPPMPNVVVSQGQGASFGRPTGQVTHQPQIPANRIRAHKPTVGNMPAESGAVRT